ncbi:hypothetical protein FZEAL_8197 [Fusarium zealandicum]|uniref:F-box domain-containing protein n=1 Tax=Fusarium zealandicum TaxID=1053134 RepID=A0A8H4UEX5_9HYPO|nr:hypothetical protein FZEAL_8197 [Fusarium zealandicum]
MAAISFHQNDILSKLLPELINLICEELRPKDLVNLRCVNHNLHSLVTPWAFRHIKLRAVWRNNNAHQGFIKIARSENLRSWVREVDVDTWAGPRLTYRSDRCPWPADFMNALPLLRCFRNTSTLNVRFDQDCGYADDSGVDETPDFRYRILDIIFQCLAGTWTCTRQKRVDETLDSNGYIPNYEVSEAPANVETDSLMSLRGLTVRNLAHYVDRRLTDSEAFNTVMDSGTLVDLKLQFAEQSSMTFNRGLPDGIGEHDVFADLHKTWLRPAVASNLRVLSLYYFHDWGWCPKMDFRFINPAEGGFPNLRVLALGTYVFSHEWQIDWIASQGKRNPYGGLQELYLDDCSVLYHAKYKAPLEQGTSVVGRDSGGNDIVVSNEGYPLRHNVPTNMAQLCTVEHHSSIHWSDILSRWRTTMTSLKVFKMGYGAWEEPDDETGDAEIDSDLHHQAVFPMPRSLHHNNPFRDFAYTPSPPQSWHLLEGVERYMGWRGMSEDREFVLVYVRFAFNSRPSGYTWLREHDTKKPGDALKPYKEGDERALDIFRETVEARRIGKTSLLAYLVSL